MNHSLLPALVEQSLSPGTPVRVISRPSPRSVVKNKLEYGCDIHESDNTSKNFNLNFISGCESLFF